MPIERLRFAIPCRPKAFSLIELVMVLVIIGALSAIALPRYARAMGRYRLQAAAHRIVNDFEAARQAARASSSARTVIFDLVGHMYRVEDAGQPANGYRVNLAGEPYGVRISAVSLSVGGEQIIFNGYGMPDTGGSIVLEAGGDQRTVTLDPSTGKGSTP